MLPAGTIKLDGEILYYLTEKQILGLQMLTNPKKKFIKFWGSGRSGKTFLICLFIALRAHLYADSHHIIFRYTKTFAADSVWQQTMLPILEKFQEKNLCKIKYGHYSATFINNSTTKIAGLRPHEASRSLSAEYQTIFLCEGNENSWDMVEQAMSRLNGIAYLTNQDGSKKQIELKFIIDLNPLSNLHWSKVAWLDGIHPNERRPLAEFKKYDNLHFKVEDNKDNIQYDEYVQTMGDASEAKKTRYLLGLYGSTEGLFFNFDDKNLVDGIPKNLQKDKIIDQWGIPLNWPRVLAIDFGYTNPFAALGMALDDANETIYIYQEYYLAGVTVPNHAINLKKIFMIKTKNQIYEINQKYDVICDHDSGDRAILTECGIRNRHAFKNREAGFDRFIEFVNKAKYKVFRICVNHIEEMQNARQELIDNTEINQIEKEMIKKDDHTIDAARYGIMHFFPPRQKVKIVKTNM